MDIVANSHVLATKKPDRFGSSLMLLIICCWFCVFFWDSEFELVVSRVGFTHKRRGTMTSVLEELKKICTEVGVPRIVIQSVLTPEMQAFCQAHHIEPDKNTTMQVDDVLVGDYYLMLDT